MNKIKVSVIVPVYNVEPWLDRCLESLANQTLEDIEVIVVNDGSPDNSQKIIDKFCEKYPNKFIGLIKENGGLSDARNYGMKHAKGEYIAFVDSDDYVDTSMYEKMYNKAIADDAEIVVCGYYKVNDKRGSMNSAQIGNTHVYGASARQNKDLIRFNAPYAWNKIVKSDLFKRTKLFFPKGLNFEDIPTMYPLLAVANKVSKVDEELYYYIEAREDSITGVYDAKRLIMIDSIELLNQRFKKLGVFDEYREQLLVLNLRHIYLRLREFGKYKDKKAQNDMVDKAFDLLDNTFPDWRTNYGKYGGFNFLISRREPLDRYQSREFWHEIVEMPLEKSNKFLNNYLRRQGGKTKPKEYYLKYRKKPIIKNCVLIESFHGKNISDSPLEIMKELLSRGGYEIFVVSNGMNWNTNSAFLKENSIAATMVLLGSKEYCKLLGRAEYLINNVSFPSYFFRRDEQVYLNTWHGTPLKTLGKNMKKGIKSMTNIQHNFLQCSHLLFPNQFTKDCIMRDYNLTRLYTGETVTSGYPRNAVFSRTTDADNMFEDGIVEKKCIYMPTWRGNSSRTNPDGTNIEKILLKIDSVLDSEHVMYVNLHPNEVNDIDYDAYKNIKPFPKNVDKYEFISEADILITDYSSIMFDYSITKKPVILFMYDYDEYMENRGMYLDVRTLPFLKAYSLDQLCDLLKDKELFNSHSEYGVEYYDKFIKYDSQDATKNIVDYIFNNQKSTSMIVEDYSLNRTKKWKVKVQMERIDDKETFDNWMSECNLNDTIVVIRDRYFHKKMNDWFYEEYNEKTTYVIFSYCRLLNKFEEWLYKKAPFLRNRFKNRLFNKARERSYMRSLPNIRITNMEEYRRLI